MARTPFGRGRAPIGTLGWVLRGAAAGAAGTTALNAVTYLDMTVRGRGTSSTPEQTVEALAEKAHVQIPGDGETRSNRVQGLGPLTGLVAGIGVGVLAGLARAAGSPHPAAGRDGADHGRRAGGVQRPDDRAGHHRPAHLVGAPTGSATSCRTWPTARS